MIDVFSLQDFRAVIKAKIEESRGVKGYRSRLAEAGGFQRSFLSQVLNSSVLLTPDHALGLCRFWNFSELETDYFLNLVNLSRAQKLDLRRYYEDKIKKMREAHQDLSTRLGRQKQVLKGDSESLYYSAWYWNAIHLCTSVPHLRSPQAIAERLKLPLGLVQTVLAGLEQMKLITKTSNAWKTSNSHLHLSKESRLVAPTHSHWRQKAISRFQDCNLSGLHYSVTFAMSREDGERVHNLILELVDKTKKIVEPSTEEEVYCFLCDYFPI
jgi:uncharacterized protein (TIGR02147 family)